MIPYEIYQHFPIIAIMTLFIGAFIVALFGEKQLKVRIVLVTIITVASTFFVFALIKPVMIDGEVLHYWLGNWEPVQGYAIGIGLEVDALSLFFALIVSFSTLMSAIFSFKYNKLNDASDKYYVLFLMLAASVLGIILTGDLFNMYVMIEIMTFAAVALTAYFNDHLGALEASFKYLIIGTIGSSLVLVGIILLYSQLHTLNIAQIAGLLLDKTNAATILAFALLFTGFSLKAYIFPFHPVAADAYGMAPSTVSTVFSGMVNKAGVYMLLRLVYIIFQTMNNVPIQGLLTVLGCLTMIVGVCMALVQHDMKRLLAFHSISQIGYVITAISLATALGISGGLYHAMNHTLFKGLLFLCAGTVCYSTNTTDLNKLGGLSKRMPMTAAIFLIGAFSISGIPPFNGFVSKWLIYHASFEKALSTNNFGYIVVTVIAVVVSVMTLASFIKVAQSVFFGQLPLELNNVKETPLSMRFPMWIMAILCVLTGVFPKTVSRILITPATNAIMNASAYIDTMMGAGYAEKFGEPPAPAPIIDLQTAGFWNPTSWLILFVILLAAIFLFVIIGKNYNGKVSTTSDDDTTDGKYSTFYSGEAAEPSMVGGSDMFWGLKYNLRGYFSFLGKMHNGIVNEYALWAVAGCAVFIVFSFIFM